MWQYIFVLDDIQCLDHFKSVKSLTFFSSSKRAIVGLMEGLQRELRWLGYDGIKTTYANPSFVNTGMANNPTSNSKKICPVLDPDFVVDKVMEAMLTNQYYIDIPNIGWIDGLSE